MKRRVRVQPYWMAVVFCHNDDIGQIVGSFLSFPADNRYRALQCLREQLPDNPKFVDEGGKLRPFQILDLRQIKPSESNMWAMRFHNFFCDMFPVHPPTVSRAWT